MVVSLSDYEGTSAEASPAMLHASFDSNTQMMLRGRPVNERALELNFPYTKQAHVECQALLALILITGLMIFVFTTFYLSITYCRKCVGILQDLCPSTKDANDDISNNDISNNAISDSDDELSVEADHQDSNRQMSALEQQEHQDHMVVATGVPIDAETVIHFGTTYYISFVHTGCDAVAITMEEVHCDILQVYEDGNCCGEDSSHDVQKSLTPVPYLTL